jgi:hypothetical protein
MGEPGWEIPEVSPWEIVNRYGRLLEKVPSARAWAGIEGGTVHFFTVVDFTNVRAEEALYGAERTLVDEVGPDVVIFDVYANVDSIKPDLENLIVVPIQLVA